MADMGVIYEPRRADIGTRQTPGEWLEYSPLLTIVICALGFGYLAREVATAGPGILLQLNHYIFLFLIVGLLLHWRPRSFVQAIARGHHAGRRRADSVPDVRGHRADDDRVGPGDADGALLRRRSPRSTPTR